MKKTKRKPKTPKAQDANRGIAHALVGAAFKSVADVINISHLARAVGVSPQRLHGYWTGAFPWPADVALLVLAASGKVKLWREGLAVHLVIPTKVIRELGPLIGIELKLKDRSRR